MIDSGESPTIGADRHPVTVTRVDGSETYPNSRLILTLPRDNQPGRMLVWAMPQAPAVDVGWTREGSELGGRNGQWVLATDNGQWTVTAERGCGCSSPLKTMPLPWGSYRMGTLR